MRTVEIPQMGYKDGLRKSERLSNVILDNNLDIL